MEKEKCLIQRIAIRLRSALNSIKEGLLLRQALHIARISKSALHRAVKTMMHKPTENKEHRNRALSDAEQDVICQLLMREEDSGHSLTLRDLSDAVSMFVSEMPSVRQTTLPFVNGMPGKDYLTKLITRKKPKIRLGRPEK